jgi:hypothetical protein
MKLILQGEIFRMVAAYLLCRQRCAARTNAGQRSRYPPVLDTPPRMPPGFNDDDDAIRAAFNLRDAARYVIDGKAFGHAELMAALVEFGAADRAMDKRPIDRRS